MIRIAVLVASRLAYMALTLAAVSVLLFALTQLLPGDVAQMILGTSATPDSLEAMRRNLGLDQPPVVQYLRWAGAFVVGDWGVSARVDVPIRDLVLLRLANSLALAALTVLVFVPLGIGLGVVAAVYRGRLPDHIVLGTTVLGVSVPEFVTGTGLVLLFSGVLGWLPASSGLSLEQISDPWVWLRQAILPVTTLTLLLLAHTSRMTRASLLQELARPYVRTARLKGLPERSVLLRHALPNALIPTIAGIAVNVGWLMGSIAVVETIYAYPGLGRLVLFALSNRDLRLIQAVVLVIATVYALANLISDLLYLRLNPRLAEQGN